MPTLSLPDPCLVLLVGPSGSGKSTFARKHFRPTEILSSDLFRAMVCDEENDQSASSAAFELLYLAADKRLARSRLTVIDATNVQPDARKPLLDIARRHHCPAVAVVFDLPEEACHAHNRVRPQRHVGADVVRLHCEQLRQLLPSLRNEGMRQVYVLASPAEIDAVVIERQPLTGCPASPP
jgi:protein phosphatase